MKFLFSIFIFLSLCLPTFATELPETLVTLGHRLGLQLISRGDPWTFPKVHAVFENQAGDSFALAIINASGKIDKLEVIEANDYFIVLIPAGEAFFHSLAISGIEKNRIATALKELTVSSFFKFSFSIFPKAYAQDCNPAFEPMVSSSLAPIVAMHNMSYIGIAKDCVYSALQGAWASTGGMMQSLWQGLNTLVSDPKTFWNTRVSEFRELQNFFREFDIRMRSTMASLSNLPPEALANILCGFVGGVGGSVLMAGGIASLVPRLGTFFSRLAQLSTTLFTMQRLGKIAQIPKDFYAKLATGSISSQRIKTLEVLSQNNMGVVIQGAMSCML
jgi:hypothetical protein